MAKPYLGQLEQIVDDLDLRENTGLDLECRHFFNGAALYANGAICASLSPAGLAVKLPAGLREALNEGGLGQPLRYFEGGRVKKGYVVLSEALVSDLDRLRELFEECFEQAGRGGQR